jgi:hypothetical protein
MRPSKAIAILTVPFAISCLVLLSGMCLTPYWDCRQTSITLDIWKPALFTLVLFLIAAAVVLYVDLLLIRGVVARIVSYRSVVLAVVGAIVATLPRILLAAFGGQGLNALSPQLEFLPFAIAGALFAMALDRLVRIGQHR